MSGDKRDSKYYDDLFAGASEEPDDFCPPDPPPEDADFLIGPLINRRLTTAQRKAANEVIEQCRAANLGSEETAIEVLRYLFARREFPPIPTGKQAPREKDDWLDAAARLLRPTPGVRGAPLSQNAVIDLTIDALEQVQATGRTSIFGFEHLDRAWLTARETKVPDKSTVRQALKSHLEKT